MKKTIKLLILTIILSSLNQILFSQENDLSNFKNLSYKKIESIERVVPSQDSIHIGYWKEYNAFLDTYVHIYTKNDSIYYHKYYINTNYEDSVFKPSFFKDKFTLNLRFNETKIMSSYSPLFSGEFEFLNDNPDLFIFIDSDNNLFESRPYFYNYRDTSMNKLFFSIKKSPEDIFQEYIDAPKKEANFQKLCAENDTNTIGYFFGTFGLTRIYKANDRQWAMMSAEGAGYDAERLAVEPHEEGFKITHISGILRGNTYYIMSSDSSTIKVYDTKYGLQATWNNSIEDYVYNGWDIGITCKESFYSLPKKEEEDEED